MNLSAAIWPIWRNARSFRSTTVWPPNGNFLPLRKMLWTVWPGCASRLQRCGWTERGSLWGGDSAGGTLASASHTRFARGFVLEEAHISYFFGHYLRSDADRDDWRFAPLDGVDETGDVRDLEGVSPAWIGLAECDPLTDEALAYADRLRLAGVAVDLEIYRGMVHGFIQFGRTIPQASTSHIDVARALRKAFYA